MDVPGGNHQRWPWVCLYSYSDFPSPLTSPDPLQKRLPNLCTLCWACICAYHVFSSLTIGNSQHRRWEWAISLPFDWKYITGLKPFRWPMVSASICPGWMINWTRWQIFYFLNRYCLFFVLIGMYVDIRFKGLYLVLINILQRHSTECDRVRSFISSQPVDQTFLTFGFQGGRLSRALYVQPGTLYMRSTLWLYANHLVQCFGNAAIGLASINLSLRTYVFYSKGTYMYAKYIDIVSLFGLGGG